MVLQLDIQTSRYKDAIELSPFFKDRGGINYSIVRYFFRKAKYQVIVADTDQKAMDHTKKNYILNAGQTTDKIYLILEGEIHQTGEF